MAARHAIQRLAQNPSASPPRRVQAAGEWPNRNTPARWPAMAQPWLGDGPPLP
jgi:hypothetical protein